MSDSQTQTDPNATTAATPSTGQANPLDALEQILKEAKQRADQNKGSSAEPAAEATPVQSQAEEEAAKMAVIQQKANEQGVVDQEAIEQQLAALQQVVTTPEYQARVSQDEQKKVTDDQKRLQADENAIIQLGHTKV